MSHWPEATGEFLSYCGEMFIQDVSALARSVVSVFLSEPFIAIIGADVLQQAAFFTSFQYDLQSFTSANSPV